MNLWKDEIYPAEERLPTYRLACPRGHAADLQLRIVADYYPRLEVDDDGEARILPDFRPPNDEPIDWSEGDTIGVDSGIWCPTCARWYPTAACLRSSPSIASGK